MASRNDHDRVRMGWALAAAIPERTAQTFYANLFATDPSTRSLFRGDLQLQGKKLTATLGFIVDHLDDPDTLLDAARALAVRHVAYGVTPDQYATVGAALISTLQELLGADFSPEDRLAWTRIYTALSAEMVDAAYPEP